jgi:hypothetical protein
MFKIIYNYIKQFFFNVNNTDFFLNINIKEESVEYGLLYGNDNLELLCFHINNKWKTNQGIIYNFHQFHVIIQEIIKKIQDDYGVQCKKILIFISIPGIQIINYHEKIHEKETMPTFFYNDDNFIMIHNCGKIYLLNGTLPVENIDNLIYETLDIYETYYIFNKLLKNNLTKQLDGLALDILKFHCPQYLLSGSLSQHLNKDTVLLDINMESTIININHKQFSYGYFYWSKGTNFFFQQQNINKELFNNFLLELTDVIKKYPKATVIIGGFKPKEFQWINHLQKLLPNKFFYLNSLTNTKNNNIFFNLLKSYNSCLIMEEETKDEIIEALENLVL